MDTQQMLALLSEQLGVRAGAELVFGEPLRTSGRTVIPVARIAYGFGSGGAPRGADEDRPPESRGAGGGGGVTAAPVGVVEIGEAGVRFVPIGNRAVLAGVFLAGIVLGAWLGRRR